MDDWLSIITGYIAPDTIDFGLHMWMPNDFKYKITEEFCPQFVLNITVFSARHPSMFLHLPKLPIVWPLAFQNIYLNEFGYSLYRMLFLWWLCYVIIRQIVVYTQMKNKRRQ